MTNPDGTMEPGELSANAYAKFKESAAKTVGYM